MNAIKFIASFMLVMLAIGMVSPMALAVEEETGLPEPGIGPESAFYGLKIAWDRTRLAFTFNREAKVQKAIGMAENRLAEAEMVAENSELAEKAKLRYEEFIGKAEENLEKIEAKKAEGYENAIESTVRTQERMEIHLQRVSTVHNRILVRLAESNMSEEQLTHLTEVFGRVEERAETSQNRVEQRQESLKARYKVLTNKTDDEINESIESYRAEYQEEIRQRITERVQTKIESKINHISDDSENEDSESDDSEKPPIQLQKPVK